MKIALALLGCVLLASSINSVTATGILHELADYHHQVKAELLQKLIPSFPPPAPAVAVSGPRAAVSGVREMVPTGAAVPSAAPTAAAVKPIHQLLGGLAVGAGAGAGGAGGAAGAAAGAGAYGGR